ncbi:MULTISPECIES: IS630 transposase-related protein [Candidatus Williamhamiltonella]|uniref:ISHde5, transposase orfA n=1 Tax=Hamiltonella defensa subsp. Acyrthosiphon pisum (strain 5AT) TaxID=572265 RepID=C4K3P6_HAMD5|nr:IS630 transposase-related protein [Candidatus Hamiltonella defensa]ACQ67189.1 ISHde5, transposase orfA [Candidatus Hamiltonella defensa 5AT (Acyrthosiphon pisum)]ATW21952.1 hypothetical protein BJP44_02025 [Candidatus Hamiltonella defensa]AYB48679.1 transposase [Candidatus Hamiltonella defensa]AYB48869.1 transposase [Candidatus Hamiltonella defensa]
MSHSVDFRRHVLNVREKEKWSIRETAKRFHIGATSITRWLKRIEKNPSSPRQRKIDKAALLKDVERYPDAYQHERAKRFGVCTKAIWSALKRLGVTYKKNPQSSQGQRRYEASLPKQDS